MDARSQGPRCPCSLSVVLMVPCSLHIALVLVDAARLAPWPQAPRRSLLLPPPSSCRPRRRPEPPEGSRTMEKQQQSAASLAALPRVKRRRAAVITPELANHHGRCPVHRTSPSPRLLVSASRPGPLQRASPSSPSPARQTTAGPAPHLHRGRLLARAARPWPSRP